MSKVFKTIRAQIKPAVVNQRFVYVLDSENPETLLARQLRDFLATMGYSEIFPNFDKIRIGTIHPFAILLAQQVLEQPQNVNVFPSVTIADSSMEEDAMILGDDYFAVAFTAEDIAKLDGYRQAGAVFASDAGWQKILSQVTSNGEVIGIRRRYHTQHPMDFNVWSENKDITSFIFDMICHFITQKRIDIHNQEGIDLAGVSGRRSGDINLDFGMLLYGANVRVQASMNHEATLFDTGIESIAEIDTQTLPKYFT